MAPSRQNYRYVRVGGAGSGEWSASGWNGADRNDDASFVVAGPYTALGTANGRAPRRARTLGQTALAPQLRSTEMPRSRKGLRRPAPSLRQSS